MAAIENASVSAIALPARPAVCSSNQPAAMPQSHSLFCSGIGAHFGQEPIEIALGPLGAKCGEVEGVAAPGEDDQAQHGRDADAHDPAARALAAKLLG